MSSHVPPQRSLDISELEARLRRPDSGENGYVEGAEELTRLEALARLRELAESGQVAREGTPGGINTHVHTSKSFAYFASPADAAWQAYRARVDVFGINDHYTLAGHGEFREACSVLGMKAIFSMEAIAMWEEARTRGETVNDPANPGRTYLTAKAITRDFSSGAQGKRDLERMNTALLERNREITRRLAKVFDDRLGLGEELSWAGVLALTPHGQPTERHICQHAAEVVEATYSTLRARVEALSRLVGGEVSKEAFRDAATLQDTLRARLVKVGGPAYVEESPEAFIPVERMRSLCLDLGAVPTYPVLGNPVTPWEESIDELYDRLEALGFYALEVIPNRNTEERLAEIVEKAAERCLPVVNGTEHNTKTPVPLVDKFFSHERFRSHFERGARIMLGHQTLRARGETGYVQRDGSLPPGPREQNLRRVERAAESG